MKLNNMNYNLKMNTFDLNNIVDGDILSIPVEDPDLKMTLAEQICDIAGNCDWVLPDSNRTKINLCVDMLSDNLETTLQLEVHPPLWTREEIESVIESMANPDTPIFADEPETPRDLYNFIFGMAQLHNENKLIMEDNTDFLEVQLSETEIKALQPVITQYMN
ncbi:hypothetical protein [Sinanaerobacter chloroacetimidivorans]|uniref:Uncharacterized protein n=1 Tax=Sinanaerobacter chloroacetimidivorans TaxID=2818044 RepID=A0A8J7W0H0_9FIRM|nr:hypothetical protein [Sinanaerobacter chloroacetimidivorans]MBR0598101.1 hypothetical protein [Sinanaerobacter chloroacetimidivorans]